MYISKETLEDCSFVPLLDEVLLHLLDENTDTIPSHMFALIVEVEVLILHIRKFNLKHVNEMRKQYNDNVLGKQHVRMPPLPVARDLFDSPG
jgi:hypothetical protein